MKLARSVTAFKTVRTKVIALGLDKVGRQLCASKGVQPCDGSAEGGNRQSGVHGGAHACPCCGQQRAAFFGDGRVQQQIG